MEPRVLTQGFYNQGSNLMVLSRDISMSVVYTILTTRSFTIMDLHSVVKSQASLKEFIRDGGDVNHRDSNGFTVLWLLFVQSKGVSYYNFVLENGGDINTLTPDNKAMVTSIHCVNKLKLFVKHGVNLDCVDEMGSTYAHYALDLDTLQYAQSVGVDLTKRNYRGETALHVYYQRFGSLNGVDINVVNYLVETGLDINSEDFMGQRIVHFAHPRDNADLVSMGADFTATDKKGWTCIHHNVDRRRLTLTGVDFYTSQGVDINARDFEGKTALILSRSPFISWSLVKSGADINCVDFHGRTVLHYSMSDFLKFKDERWMMNVRIETTKSMIGSGAALNLVDKTGKACMDDLLLKVKRCHPNSKKGKKYYEILRVALDNGLDVMRYGRILFDMTERKVNADHNDPAVKRAVERWLSATYRYTMIMIRSRMEDGPVAKKSKKNWKVIEFL